MRLYRRIRTYRDLRRRYPTVWSAALWKMTKRRRDQGL